MNKLNESCIAMGGTWNGSSCQMGPAATQGAITCASIGGSWNGSSCETPVSAQSVCSASAGVWTYSGFNGGGRGGYACVWPWEVKSGNSSGGM